MISIVLADGSRWPHPATQETVTMSDPVPATPILTPSPKPLPKRVRHPVTAAVAVGRIADALEDLDPADRRLVLARLAAPRKDELEHVVSYGEKCLADLDATDRAKVLNFLDVSEALK